MSRTVPYLSELQPAMFCEVSPELAAEAGLVHGGWATIYSSRAAIEARVLVTDRIPPLEVQGRRTHQIGLPYHWGTRGLTTGDAANDLSLDRARPERAHPGGKAFSVGIKPGRRPRGAALPEFVDATMARRRAELPREREPVTEADGRHEQRVGFFTDTSVCIGCKACEVACKEWNLVPEDGLGLDRRVVRQHLRARREHLAARRLHRAERAAAARRRAARSTRCAG